MVSEGMRCLHGTCLPRTTSGIARHRTTAEVFAMPRKCVPGEQEVWVHLLSTQKGNISGDTQFYK